MTTTQSASNAANDAMEATRAPRQIIVGCDGTNNTLTGGVHDTNVLKIIGQLVPESDQRLLYYDTGVGAPDQVPPLGFLNSMRRKWERLAGLANGRGIYENIAEAYLFLVDNYRSGDQIYLFGFSRGAFTARCVAGMVELFGIIRTDSKPLILTLVRVYFSTPKSGGSDIGGWQGFIARRTSKLSTQNKQVADQAINWSPSTPDATIKKYLLETRERRSTREEVVKQVREEFASVDGATAVIHFIGVWDTVESVGIPGLQRTITNNGSVVNKKHIRHVRHALSMDEHRVTFAPRLYWDNDYDHDKDDPVSHRSLKQRWFRGVHSDIGGGYGVMEAGLSDQAYAWMLDEAIACGLDADAELARATHPPKPLIAHDACYQTPWWGVAGLTVRSNRTPRTDGPPWVDVVTAGAASAPNPRIFSVWRAVSKTTILQALGTLVVVAALFCLYGWLASKAIATVGEAGLWSRIGTGVTALEMWQKAYFLEAFTGGVSVGPTLLAVWPAALAMFVDFGLIVAYSWLVGLFASWAFHVIVGQRDPALAAPRMSRLGRAPMFLVLADVLENVLTLLTLWCIAYGFQRMSYGVGAAMMIAGAIKWACLLDTLALLAFGLAKRVPALPLPARAGMPRRPR